MTTPPVHQQERSSPQSPQPAAAIPKPVEHLAQPAPNSTTINRAQLNPRALSTENVLQLQRTVGNRVVSHLLAQVRGEKSAAPPQARRQPAAVMQGAPDAIAIQRAPKGVIQRDDDALAMEFNMLDVSVAEEVKKIQAGGAEDLSRAPRQEEKRAQAARCGR